MSSSGGLDSLAIRPRRESTVRYAGRSSEHDSLTQLNAVACVRVLQFWYSPVGIPFHVS